MSNKTTIVMLAMSLALVAITSTAFSQSGSRQAPVRSQQTQQSQLPPQNYAAPRRVPRTRPQAARPATENRIATRNGIDQVDHRPWDDLLSKYVDARGNVDYAAWQADRNDRDLLRTYLKQLARVDPRAQSSRVGQLAFWINTYNALTVEGILQVYPTRSIKDHAPDERGYDIWDDFQLSIGDQKYSLNDIEHKVLRPMGDPRIHFAIVCASRGCPHLANRAYFPQTLDRQMDDNARRFLADPSKFQYDVGRREIRVSPIIEWFAADFGRNDAERMKTLAPFLPDGNAARLAESGQARVSYLEYDWNLNVATRSVEPQTQISQSFRQSYDSPAGPGGRVEPAQFSQSGCDHSRCREN